MAIAWVQTGSEGRVGGATNVSSTFTTPPVVGNKLVAYVACWAANGNATTVTDNKGNVWTRRGSQFASGDSLAEIWEADVTATGSGFAVKAAQASGSTDMNIRAVEYSGVGAFDKVAVGGANGGASLQVGPTATLASSDELVCILLAHGTTGVTTPSGFTQRGLQPAGTSIEGYSAADKIVTSNAGALAVWTGMDPQFSNNEAVLVTFQAAAGGATPTALTATGVTSSTPSVGSPTLGQKHALTGNVIATSTPAVGTPTLGQTGTLTATAVTTSTPVVGSPALGQTHALTGATIATSAPSIGTPALTSGAAAWTPASLYVGGATGFLLDPSRLDLMWQDTAGTNPVTAVGQTVSKIMDAGGSGLAVTASGGNATVLRQDTGGRYYLDANGPAGFNGPSAAFPISSVVVAVTAAPTSPQFAGLITNLTDQASNVDFALASQAQGYWDDRTGAGSAMAAPAGFYVNQVQTSHFPFDNSAFVTSATIDTATFSNTANRTFPNGLKLFADRSNSGRGWIGRIYGLFTISTILSQADRMKAEAWLGAKAGLTLADAVGPANLTANPVTTGTPVVSSPRIGKRYYISQAGNDANDGLTVATAKQTVDGANALSLQPADVVAFRGGDVWNNAYLVIQAGSTAGRIIYTSYGTGRATINSMNIQNVSAANPSGSYWTLDGINLNGIPATSHGLQFYTSEAGTVFTDMTVRNCDVGSAWLGIAFGHDANTGSIRNVLVENCIVSGCSGTGITNYGYGAHANSAAARTDFFNVVVRGCLAYGNGQHGIAVQNCTTALVETSVAHDNGASANDTVGIYLWQCDGGVIRYCESFNNTATGLVDGDGFDIDTGCVNCRIEYCYSHGNKAAGFMLYSANWAGTAAWNNNTIRYNVSENDGSNTNYGSIHAQSSVACGAAYVYGNTVFTNVAGGAALRVTDGNINGRIANNVFTTSSATGYLARLDTAENAALLITGNDYFAYGTTKFRRNGVDYTSLALLQAADAAFEKISGVNVGLTVNPLLVSPGTGGTLQPSTALPTWDASLLGGYRLQGSSPMLTAGRNLASEFGISAGGFDFYGNPVPLAGAYSVGSYNGAGVAAAVSLTASAVTGSTPQVGSPALGSVHVLTGTVVVTSTPVVGSPALGQANAMTASVVVTSAPVVGSPSLGQTHVIAATATTTSVPQTSAPALGQTHLLAATPAATTAPQTSAPVFGQKHTLTGQPVATSAPQVGTASLVPSSAVTATPVVTSAPAVGTPALGQTHVIVASPVATATPAPGLAVVGQKHQLTPSVAVTTSTPFAGFPGLAQTHALAGVPVVPAAPVVGNAVPGVIGQLSANPAVGFVPQVGNPTLGQTHNLGAPIAAVGSTPATDLPIMRQINALVGQPIVTSTPASGAPPIGQTHQLIAAPVATSSPAAGFPVLGQTSIVTPLGIVTAAPALGTPAVGQTHVLGSGVPVVSPLPVVGAPGIGQAHVLVAGQLETGLPVVGFPPFGQVHVLAPDDAETTRPVVGTPKLFTGKGDASAPAVWLSI